MHRIQQITLMTSLDPHQVSFNISHHTASSSPSASILQSRQVITELERNLEGQPTSSALTVNRQISTGTIVDYKVFAQDSDTKKQLLVRDGETDESVIFSYIVQEQKKGHPSKVIYRWVKRMADKTKGINLREEEHIYRGEMREGRKHGQGEYIIIKRWADCSETQLRYQGKWVADSFSRGTYENEKGERKQIKQAIIHTFKSNANFKGKTGKNVTIKLIAKEMGSKKLLKMNNKNGTCVSILNKEDQKQNEQSSIHTIEL